jgi:hypothetical protein
MAEAVAVRRRRRKTGYSREQWRALFKRCAHECRGSGNYRECMAACLREHGGHH